MNNELENQQQGTAVARQMDSAASVDVHEILAAVEALRQEVGRLTERFCALEKVLPESVRAAAWNEPARVATPEISDEVIAAVSAAIAAYLGVKPQIRQIRLLRSDAWAQRARVTIQASHSIAVHHS